jgi:hypothetical protein
MDTCAGNDVPGEVEIDGLELARVETRVKQARCNIDRGARPRPRGEEIGHGLFSATRRPAGIDIAIKTGSRTGRMRACKRRAQAAAAANNKGHFSIPARQALICASVMARAPAG